MKIFPMRSFKQYLYEDITKEQLTPTHISNLMGFSRCETVSKWLRGKNLPSYEHMVKLSELYKYPYIKLLLWIAVKKSRPTLQKLLCKAFDLK